MEHSVRSGRSSEIVLDVYCSFAADANSPRAHHAGQSSDRTR